MRIIYLHGFASSPASRKAQVFRERLEAKGVLVSVPALDGGDFSSLTISGQYRILEQEAAGEPVSLIGSSMGGYLAALYAARHPEVEKLVLLAPAFGFHERWPKIIGEEAFAAWKSDGWMEIFHYGEGRQKRLGWQMAEDAAKWEAEPSFSQPALLFHGLRDETVPPESSQRYADTHPNVTLRLFDAGHELTEVVEEMWEMTARFLGIGGR